MISVTGVFLRGTETDRAAADRLAHSRRRHRLRRGRGRARPGRRALRAGDRLRHLDGGDLRHAVLVTRDVAAGDAASHPVHQHHHLRVPRHALGRRRLLLVDARRAEVRRGVLRHLRQTAAIISIVAVWMLSKQITEYSVTAGAVLDHGRRHAPDAAEHRPDLRPARMDRGDVRLRRAHDRDRRRRGRLAVRAAQHGAAADADRLLRAAPATAPPGSR